MLFLVDNLSVAPVLSVPASILCLAIIFLFLAKANYCCTLTHGFKGRGNLVKPFYSFLFAIKPFIIALALGRG